MKTVDVQISGVYEVKVSGKVSRVKILNKLTIGKGWRGVNLTTGRAINIRSSQRLRKKVVE